MPKCPRQHILEDLAKNQIRDTLIGQGWTVEDIDEDYGLDFMVQIFEEGKATPWSFFIQSKATDKPEKYLLKDGQHFSYQMKTEHLEFFSDFPQPVVLTFFDSKTKAIYWENLQYWIEDPSGILRGGRLKTSGRKKVPVRIPTRNILDAEGLIRIRNASHRRLRQLSFERSAMATLLDLIREDWGVEITAEAGDLGGLIAYPAGRFIKEAPGRIRLTGLGLLQYHMAEVYDAGGRPRNIAQGPPHIAFGS